MKKWLALLLAAGMCLWLVGCVAGNGGGEINAEDFSIETDEDGITWLVVPDSKTLGALVSKVTITKDNWDEYFEDYEYTEHIQRKNDFGDIEEEYDAVHIGFGLKENLLGLADEVSFKFDGMTEYSNTNFDVTGKDTEDYKVYKANQAAYNVYNYATDELVEQKQLGADEVKPHYLLEIKYEEGEEGMHFGDHTCIDAMGDVYLVTLPEGVYNGEQIDQIRYLSGGGGSFCISNLERYYNAQ